MATTTTSTTTTLTSIITTLTTSTAGTPITPTFGQKEDTVWIGFITLSAMVVLFDLVLTLGFVLKTVYRPTKIFKSKKAPSLDAATKNTKTFKQPDNGSRSPSPKKNRNKEQKDVMFDVSDLGSVSESNSEDSLEENQIMRGKYSVSYTHLTLPTIYSV